MSAISLMTYATWGVFWLIAAITAVTALRSPRRTTINIAMVFAAPALIAAGQALAPDWLQATAGYRALVGTLFLAVGYLMLRTVGDFVQPPRWVLPLALALLFPLALLLGGLSRPLPPWALLLIVAYFLGCQVYAAAAFVHQARRTRGVTCRRLWAAASGSLLLGLVIVASSLSGLPGMSPLAAGLMQLSALLSALSFYVGFAPPLLLKRAWQTPELRDFLSRTATLPRLPSTAAILDELERGAATSVGGIYARIGLWDEASGRLCFRLPSGPVEIVPDDRHPSGQAFLYQRAVLASSIAVAQLPPLLPTETAVRLSVLTSPITAGERRLGVLAIYASQTPIFAEDDLLLVRLLADQAAVILESRQLIDNATRVQAREEATRLKDDFLSAAAHDLKTPLTALLAQAQLMERRAERDPAAPADLRSIRMIAAEAQRLRAIVLELLDAARVDTGQLLSRREETDLVALLMANSERLSSPNHVCRVQAPARLLAWVDPVRVSQLLDNLLENAVKYSPQGGEIHIGLAEHAGVVELEVRDHGIGVPPGETAQIFDRFYRGSNVDDRRFVGMGLGLYICRGIVEQHGGQIVASNPAGGGTLLRVTLPVGAPSLVAARLDGRE